MVERTAVNRDVVGSSPTRGAFFFRKEERSGKKKRENGSVVKRLRHRPFTAVTRVRVPSESFSYHYPYKERAGGNQLSFL